MKHPKKLWKSIRSQIPKDTVVFVDFGEGKYPDGIRMVMLGFIGFYEEDEGDWKGMGSSADENAKRWCLIDDAFEVLRNTP